MNFRRIIVILIFVNMWWSFLYPQAKRDPRMTALAGSYTTIADGVYAVGVNPANLAYQFDKPFMWQMGTINFGFVNNFFSLERWSGLSGVNLERNNQEKKNEIFNELAYSHALNLTVDTHMAIPVMNYSAGNMAFTSDIVMVSDLSVPEDVFRLMLEGNPMGESMDISLDFETIGLAEYGFSFAVPYEKFSWGATLKYLQGLFYLGIDPDSTEISLVTDTTAFYGSGRYFVRQGIGGSGFGFDIGFRTNEFNGWTLGVSMINLFGTISWNKPSLIKDILGVDEQHGLFTFGGEEVVDGSAMVYAFEIDSLNAVQMIDVDYDDIFTSSRLVVRDTTDEGRARPFSTRYPSLLRFGISKQVDPDILIISDLVAGFQDKLYVMRRWRWSIGAEFTRFPGFPLRIGYSWAGADFKEFGLGFGWYFGPVMFDFGLAFRNGLWIHSMEGLGISMGLTITGLKGRGK